jgi:hypothetical protein
MHTRAMQYLALMQKRDEQIAAIAHFRWLMRGCSVGSRNVDWFGANRSSTRQFLSQLDLGIQPADPNLDGALASTHSLVGR